MRDLSENFFNCLGTCNLASFLEEGFDEGSNLGASQAGRPQGEERLGDICY